MVMEKIGLSSLSHSVHYGRAAMQERGWIICVHAKNSWGRTSVKYWMLLLSIIIQLESSQSQWVLKRRFEFSGMFLLIKVTALHGSEPAHPRNLERRWSHLSHWELITSWTLALLFLPYSMSLWKPLSYSAVIIEGYDRPTLEQKFLLIFASPLPSMEEIVCYTEVQQWFKDG